MDAAFSVDIDSKFDFDFCQFLLKNELVDIG